MHNEGTSSSAAGFLALFNNSLHVTRFGVAQKCFETRDRGCFFVNCEALRRTPGSVEQ